MPIFDGNLPYTNLHELNLDWIVKYVGEVKTKTDAIDSSIEEAKTYSENAKESEENALYYSELAEQYKNQIAEIFVTPEMFNAVGDEVTDDTQAVQDAINYCGVNKKPLILTKIYGVTGLKLNYNDFSMYGFGETTGFSALDSSNVFTTDNAMCTDMTFRDFIIKGNQHGGRAFYSTTSHRLSSYLFDNLTVKDFFIAFDIESWVSHITNCMVSYNNTAFLLHDCNALTIDNCSIYGFEASSPSEGVGIQTSHANTEVNIVNNTFQRLRGGAMLIYSGICYRVVGNYFEYNDSATLPVILFDGVSSSNLHDVIIDNNYIAPTGSASTSQIAVDCRKAKNLHIGMNRITTQFTTFYSLDVDCGGIHDEDITSTRLINNSNYLYATRSGYLEGTTSHPANTLHAWAWDRYRSRPIWWDGSKWVYSDGSART